MFRNRQINHIKGHDKVNRTSSDQFWAISGKRGRWFNSDCELNRAITVIIAILIVEITFQFGKLSGYGVRGHIEVMGVTCSASDYFQCNWPGTSEINIITGKFRNNIFQTFYIGIFSRNFRVYMRKYTTDSLFSFELRRDSYVQRIRKICSNLIAKMIIWSNEWIRNPRTETDWSMTN